MLFVSVASVLAQIAPEAPQSEVTTPQGFQGWLLLLALPLLSVAKIVIEALPKNAATTFLGKVIDFFSANTKH